MRDLYKRKERANMAMNMIKASDYDYDSDQTNKFLSLRSQALWSLQTIKIVMQQVWSMQKLRNFKEG